MIGTMLCAAASALATPDAGAAAALFESFENTFGAWTSHGSVGCEPDCELEFSVTLSQEQAHDGEWSLDFTASGLHDDGTVWIQRPVVLTRGTWDIDLEFQLWSMPSDLNNWEVVAYIGHEPPETEADFTIIGSAGIGGWSPYSHSETLAADAPTTVWVALGYNIVWETVRTHWFDSVTIDGIPAQPLGDLDGDGAVGTGDLLILLGAWGPCADPCPPCAADLDGDCAVGTSDLLVLLGEWG